MGQRMRRVEQLAETLISRFDAIKVGINGVRINDGRHPRAQEEYDIPINQPIRADRRAQISGNDSKKEETQRHQLFRTRCTIDGCFFNLFIDSERCENIIGRLVVQALQLPVEKHPNPHTIWYTKSAK